MSRLLASSPSARAPQPAPGPVSPMPPVWPGRAASRQLPWAGGSLKVTLAASRCALGGQDISVALVPEWGNRLQGKKPLQLSLLSWRCQGGTTLSPQTRGVEASRVTPPETRRVHELLFGRCVPSSPLASSRQPRTGPVPFDCSSLPSSSIIKRQVPRCWLRQEAEAGRVLPRLSLPRGTACPRARACLIGCDTVKYGSWWLSKGTPAEVLYKGTITRIIGEDSPSRAEKAREDAMPKGHVIYEGKKGHVLSYEGKS